MKKKLQSIRNLKKRAWREFSEFIRRRNSDYYGINSCFTCGAYFHWKEMNAGHFQHNKLDFDEMNVNVQCVRCNKWLSGKLDAYALRLIKKHGLEAVDELILRAKKSTVEKYSRQDLEDIYNKYKKLNQGT